MRLLSARSRAAVVVAGVVGALTLSSCSIYDVQLPGGADLGDDPIKVHIMFRDVLDLVPQSTVKVDDVTVGKVTKIELKGYIADVTVALPKTVELPDNARAEIRQTSLLGEKFVSLSKPGSPVGRLGNGDTIDLANSGRNPEIEEVFGALALLLNGGGVGQLKTISQELNTAFGGREKSVKSIITQVSKFMGQLDANKGSIITALENLNRLSLELRRQDGTIKAALDDIPEALASVDSQRADLVKMLKALANLSSVGVKVIQASKESTIDSLRNLAPVLAALGEADENLPKSLQVILTYPFIDEAVGRDPQVAKDLRMGDFTNLSVDLTLDLFNLPTIPGAPGVSIADLLDECAATPLASGCSAVSDLLSGKQLQQVCTLIPALCQNTPGNGGGGQPTPNPGGGGGLLGGVTGSTPQAPTTRNPLTGLLGGILGRTAPGSTYDSNAFDPNAPTDPFLLEGTGYDPGLGTLLLQGVAFE